MKISAMDKLLFFTLIVLSSFSSFAQVKSYDDYVYLKNGSIIKGNVLEVIPEDQLKVETSDGKLLEFRMAEVEKIINGKGPTENITSDTIVKENIKIKEEEVVVTHIPKKKFRQKGTYHMVRLGQFMDALEEPPLAFSIINGFQFNEYFALGLGAEVQTSGSDNYNNGTTDLVIYPIFFDLRVYIPKRRVHPMFFLDLGYIIPENTESKLSSQNSNVFSPTKGGIYRAFGSGIKLFINNKFTFIAEGGIWYQTLKGYNLRRDFDTSTQDYVDIKVPMDKKTLSPRINIGFGYNWNTK